MSFIFRSQAKGIPNLRQYTTQATLPPLRYTEDDPLLPPPGHASHKNYLTIRPEAYRRLEVMNGIADTVWTNMTACLDHLIPSTHIQTKSDNPATGDGLTIPNPLPENFPSNLAGRPDHILRLLPWIDTLPFATVKRILHLSLPETLDWAFRPGTQPVQLDPEIFCYYTWSPRTPAISSNPSLLKAEENKRLLVAIQPPWILTLRDLEDFADSRSFPPFVIPGDNFPSYHSKDRLWAKVWDACVREKIHYFALTSYNHWVFGVFSKGYTNAWVTNVLDFDSTSPTIVEALTYWVASAMGCPGGVQPPKVGFEIDPNSFQTPSTAYDLLAYGADVILALFHYSNPLQLPQPRRYEYVVFEDSESDWDGSSIATDETSAGVCPTVLTSTDGGVLERNLYSPSKKNVFPLIRDWLEKKERAQRNFDAKDNHDPTERYWQDPIEESPFVWEVLQRTYQGTETQPERLPSVGDWLG